MYLPVPCKCHTLLQLIICSEARAGHVAVDLLLLLQLLLLSNQLLSSKLLLQQLTLLQLIVIQLIVIEILH